MFDSIDWSAVLTGGATISPWGIIGLVIIAIVRGWLIPRASHNAQVKSLEGDRDRLWDANTKKDETIALLTGTNQNLVGSIGQAVIHTMGSLPKPPNGEESAS